MERSHCQSEGEYSLEGLSKDAYTVNSGVGNLEAATVPLFRF